MYSSSIEEVALLRLIGSNLIVRTHRFLLLILLILAIPMAGYAGLVAPKVPCPMKMAAMAEQYSDTHLGHALSTQMADCCNDLDTLLKTGQPCKAGQDCKIGSLGLSVHFPTIPVSFNRDAYLARLNDRAIELRTIPIWRPPA